MNYRILIADDEEMDRKAIALILENEFSELDAVLEAKNGIELVQIALDEKIDIAIVDIEMPGINGIDAIRMLREKGCCTKIIINTAHSKFDFAVDSLKLAATDFLVKPMRREKLVAAVEKCIQQLNEENERSENESKYQNIICDLKPAIANEFINSIISDRINQNNLPLYSSLLNILPNNGAIMVFQLSGKVDNDKQTAMEGFKNISEQISEICSCVVGQVNNTEIVALVREGNEVLDGGWIRSLADMICRKFFVSTQVGIHAGVGRKVKSVLELYESYCEAKFALKHCGPRQVILYDDCCKEDESGEQMPESGLTYSKKIAYSLQYIQNNYSKDISLEQLADEIGVSMFYLSRLFKQELHINFQDYLTSTRIEAAKELMRKGSYSIRQLAEKVGYNNHTYFCRAFKKATGRTIGEYRDHIHGLTE